MKFFLGLLLGLLLTVGIAAAAFKTAWGGLTDLRFDDDGGAKLSQTLQLSDFDRISVAGVFDLDVMVGEDFAVEVHGAQKALDGADIYVENRVLVLDIGDTKLQGRRRVLAGGLNAQISLPVLAGVDIAGVVDGEIEGISADEFSIEFSGVGELDLDGECGVLKASMSGIGELDAARLKCRDVEVDVSGIGEARFFASDRIDASFGGLGKIEVEGSPPIVVKQADSPFARISVR
ncbi:MAG: DUF2807 domain-containing protein [Parvularculaceae bacterium]|nr:DUF2807 domain-containing protein [Parvularculaceae bacterium]